MNLETTNKITLVLLTSVRESIATSMKSFFDMLFRIFSPSLDESTKWFALNDRLCGKEPRKFRENGVFSLFADEIRRLKIDDLHDGNGGHVWPEWFGKGSWRGSEYVYVGTSFAVLAGNLVRRNPSEVEYFRSEAFLSLKCAINIHDLRVNNVGHGGSSPKDRAFDAKGIYSSNLRPSIDEEETSAQAKNLDGNTSCCPPSTESPPRTQSAPKCSTPTTGSPPQFIVPGDSPSSSLNDTSKSGSSISEIANTNYAPNTKKRKIRHKVETVMNDVKTLCEGHGESLGDLIAQSCLFQRIKKFDGKKIISHVFSEVAKELGVREAFDKLVPKKLWEKRVDMMSVPDWILLLCKLESKISDDGWQMFLNRTNLGKSGKSSDTQILLSKNSIKALRSMVFEKVNTLLDIKKIENPDIPGYRVSLASVVTWLIREQRLHGNQKTKVQLCLKLDGRPFFGRNQVLIGVVPTETSFRSNQSCKSVYPLAIANCKEDRETLKKLIVYVNKEKDELKRNGITVDGIKHTVNFKVILDLKALYLLLQKVDDEKFQLGQQGVEVECSFICKAFRGCNCDLGSHSVCLEHFVNSKANIGGFTGIRDDLEFLLEEELSSINLCALHCELRNTEQLLKSLGLFCFKVGTLDECNNELSKYGPENFNKRITVKLKEGQETTVERHNIQVSSFSGNTERQFLANIELIVRNSLPHEKLKIYYADPECAKWAILNKVSFCSERIKYFQDMIAADTFTRDFGSRTETFVLKGSEVEKEVTQRLQFCQSQLCEIETRYKELSKKCTGGSLARPKQRGKKRQKVQVPDGDLSQLSDYAAEVVFQFFVKVYTEWKEIAEVLRDRVFKEDEQHLIDIFDIKCKEWGFLLREVFGRNLGTGDYGHITIEHASMFLRNFLSLKEFTNQGFEATHSAQRLVYTKATSHDRHGYATSILQILQHVYAVMFLFMRLSFRAANESMENYGKAFHFRGCGWSRRKHVTWSKDDMAWIVSMNELFLNIFGDDFLQYGWDKEKKGVIISPETLPSYQYDHLLWEKSTPASSPTQSSPAFSPAQYTPASSPTRSSPASSPAQSSPAQSTSASSPSQSTTASHPTPSTSASSPSQPSPASSTAQSSPAFSPAQSSPAHSSPAFMDNGGAKESGSQPSVIIKTSVPSYSEDLRACATRKNSTRGQLSSYNLPPVIQITDDEIELVNCPERLSNPLKLSFRPSESTVRKGYRLINQASGYDSDDEDLDIAVKFGGLGVFDTWAMDIWLKASSAASIKARVKEEERWLQSSNGALTGTQIKEVGSLLFDSEPEQEILRINDVIVDANDLSSLACERFVTGFVIDALCLKFCEGAMGKSLYLPSFTQTWASCGSLPYLKSKLKSYISGRNLSEIQWLLTPIHVNGNHWGLLCINMVLREVFYDDGLKLNHPSNLCEIVQKIFQAISCSPVSNLNIVLPIRRFGMPTQPSVGEGCASCGVGVVLAAHDFLVVQDSSIPKFNWTFQDMTKHRQKLLYKFVEWR